MLLLLVAPRLLVAGDVAVTVADLWLRSHGRPFTTTSVETLVDFSSFTHVFLLG